MQTLYVIGILLVFGSFATQTSSTNIKDTLLTETNRNVSPNPENSILVLTNTNETNFNEEDFRRTIKSILTTPTTTEAGTTAEATTEPTETTTAVTTEPPEPTTEVTTEPTKPTTEVTTEPTKPTTEVTTEPTKPSTEVTTEPTKPTTEVTTKPIKPTTQVTTEQTTTHRPKPTQKVTTESPETTPTTTPRPKTKSTTPNDPTTTGTSVVTKKSEEPSHNRIVKRSVVDQSDAAINVTVARTSSQNNDLAVEFYVVDTHGAKMSRHNLDSLLRESIAQLQQEFNTPVVVVNYAPKPAEEDLSAVELTGVSKTQFNEFGFKTAVADGLNKKTLLLVALYSAGEYSAYDVNVANVKDGDKKLTVSLYVAETTGEAVTRTTLDKALESSQDAIAKGAGAESANVVPTPSPTPENKVLEPFAVALIVIACVVVVVVIGIVGYKMVKKNRRQPALMATTPPQSYSNSGYDQA